MTIDIGDAANIHPGNKQDVGKRLALLARHTVQGEDLAHTGPVFTGMQVQGDRATLSFDTGGRALAVRGDDRLHGFELAGVDGLDLLRKVRAKGPGLPFILMSNRSDSASVREVLPLHPTAYLSKPLNLDNLRKRLEDMRVVEYMPEQEGKVFFGAWVDIENEQGETKRFRIVGYDEIYERMDYISIDSPMARALLRKEVDDEAIVQTPNGEMCWWITGIEYIK